MSRNNSSKSKPTHDGAKVRATRGIMTGTGETYTDITKLRSLGGSSMESRSGYTTNTSHSNFSHHWDPYV